MDMREIERKSLVVAIWDKDSKSKDDFMAGVCVVRRMFKYHNKSNTTRSELDSKM